MFTATLACLGSVHAQQSGTDAPAPVVQGYVYIEPYLARAELLVGMPTVLTWLGNGDSSTALLSPQSQTKVREQASGLMGAWCSMTSDQQPVEGRLVSVSVVKGQPGKTEPLKAEDPVTVADSMIGVVWEFPISAAPELIEVRWNAFRPPVTRLPVRAYFGEGSEDFEISAGLPVVRWRNNNRLPKPEPLAAVPQIEEPSSIPVPVAGILWLFGGIVFYIWTRRSERHLPGGALTFVTAWLLGAMLMSVLLIVHVRNPFGPKIPEITEVKSAQEIVAPLLRNVYRAFDHREESQIYDVLERSVDGELLRRLYLETIQALTLDNADGTRVQVSDLDVQVDGVEPPKSGAGFDVQCQWTALGTVGHWGHMHQRVNRYKARLHVVPAAGAWKLAGLEVQEERRL